MHVSPPNDEVELEGSRALTGCSRPCARKKALWDVWGQKRMIVTNLPKLIHHVISCDVEIAQALNVKHPKHQGHRQLWGRYT